MSFIPYTYISSYVVQFLEKVDWLLSLREGEKVIIVVGAENLEDLRASVLFNSYSDRHHQLTTITPRSSQHGTLSGDAEKAPGGV